MNLPSGEICCPERPLRLSDSVSVGVCLLWAGTGWEPPSKARPVTARASFFKGHLPGDVTLSDEPLKRLVSSCPKPGLAEPRHGRLRRRDRNGNPARATGAFASAYWV